MADLSSVTDEQLASVGFNADSGEKTAELISRYSSTVFTAAAKYAGSADYEELVSDGMVALLNAISHYDENKGSFAAFASVCISNGMKNTVDRANRRKARLDTETQLEKLTDTSLSPEELAILRESTSEMSDKMKVLLTELERRCLDGVILGLSYAEIAEGLGIEKKSVDNAVARARAKLRAEFPDII